MIIAAAPEAAAIFYKNRKFPFYKFKMMYYNV